MATAQLADLKAAQAAAVTLSGEILKDLDGKYWKNGNPWRLHVTDEAQQLLFTLHFSADVPSAPVLFRPVASSARDLPAGDPL
jgi:hypothetical protein